MYLGVKGLKGTACKWGLKGLEDNFFEQHVDSLLPFIKVSFVVVVL